MPKKKRRANGEHHIKEIKKGQWRGEITIGTDENGKRIRKVIYGSTKKEASDKLNEIENKVKTGLYLDKSLITIYHLCNQMLETDLSLNVIKEVTYYRYLETLKRLKPIYNIPMQQLNSITLQNFMTEQKHYSDEVIGKIYSLLKRVIAEALKRKIITENPLEDVKKPKSTKKKEKVRALTEEEQRKLFNLLVTEDIQYSQQMLLSMLAGMRMGEINALKVKDVNFRFNTVSISRSITRGQKGEALLGDTAKTETGNRTFQMTGDVAFILKDAIQEKEAEEMIFLHKGKLISTAQVNSQYVRILKKYDIIDTSIPGKVDLHSLRHTFATRCIESNMPPKVLQSLLGHRDIKTTMNVYGDVFNRFQADHIENASNYLKEMGISLTKNTDKEILQA